MKRIGIALILALIVGVWVALPGRAFTVYSVTRTDDPVPDNCLPNDCSLREAIRAANAAPGADLIVLPTGSYILSLPYTKNDPGGANGDLNITDSLTIHGAGAANTIIDGNQLDRVLSIGSGIDVTVNAVTIQNGSRGLGGAIYSIGNLTLNNATVRNNISPFGPGGGIYQYIDGVLTLNNSTVSGNSAPDGMGGGIYNLGTVRLNNSTISGNYAHESGGGLANEGGAIYAINSTISANRTDLNGGGIANWHNGQVELYNVTLAANIADFDHNNSGSGGGIHNVLGATAVMRNSLIGNNANKEAVFIFTPDDCAGSFSSGGYNLIEATTGCIISGLNTGNKFGLDPKLGPLANNGGPTQTHAPQDGSPAIDAGNPGGCADGQGALLLIDQRGYVRPSGGQCDMGAVEFGAAAPTPMPLPIPTPTPPDSPSVQLLYLPLIIK